MLRQLSVYHLDQQAINRRIRIGLYMWSVCVKIHVGI